MAGIGDYKRKEKGSRGFTMRTPFRYAADESLVSGAGIAHDKHIPPPVEAEDKGGTERKSTSENSTKVDAKKRNASQKNKESDKVINVKGANTSSTWFDGVSKSKPPTQASAEYKKPKAKKKKTIKVKKGK